MHLANCVSKLLINGRPTFINGPGTLPRNAPSRFITFLVVPFNKIPLS